MSRRLLLGMLTLLSLSVGCQRFKDRFDSVATLCGVEPTSIQADELFVKLESPQGEELSAETLLTTRSRFLLPTRTTQTLNISSRGCVRVPAASGVLQAFSSAQGWSVARTLEPIQGRGFIRVPMQTSPRVSAELQCPAQGFFAHKDLAFPLRWTSDGSLHATRFEMTAYDESQQKNFVLFEKPYGLHLTDLPQNLPTENLPEGQYLLRLTFQTSTEGWDVPGFIPTRTESCPLTVLHRRPEMGGLDGYSLENRIAVFAKGDILPWKTPSLHSDLLFCSEKRGQDLDESGYPESDSACRPQGICQDMKNFRKGGAIVAEEPGVFDYYAYAEDKAGNRSSLSCQTLVVTEKKPDLQLLWSEADWNKPSAQMRIPRADVQLRILAKHPQLEDAALASRYQCKAEFVREDQSVVSGQTMICSSGRCRNQSLEKYIPCDSDLTLSILDLWPYMKASGGELRVFVKADDRAGHIEEQMATVGIQPERWRPALLSPTTDLPDAIFQMLQDRQGRIFTMKPTQIQQRDELQNTWNTLPKPAEAENGTITKAWFSQEGEIHAEWQVTLPSASQFSYFIFRMTETGWQKLPSFDAQDLVECRQPQAFHRGGFWCSTTKGLAVYEGGTWNMIPYPTAEEGGDCVELPQRHFFLRDQAKTLWLSCNSTLFQKPVNQNSWLRLAHPQPLVKIAIDAKERVWTVRGTDRDDLIVLVTEADTTRVVPNPKSYDWVDLRPQYFVIGPSSEIIFGDSYWDDNQGSWQVFPYFAHRQPRQRVTAQFLQRGELIWSTEKGILQWDGERLRDWDVSVHDLNISLNKVQAALGSDGVPWVLASPGGSYEFPYQFQIKKWAYFPKPNLSPSSNIVGLWVDRQSKPHIYIPNDGLYTLASAGWTRSTRSPGLNEETALETDTFEPTILSSQGIYRWTPAQDWTHVIRFPEPRYYWGGTRDAKGRFWLYQDSMELGLIDGSSFSSVSLGPDSGSGVKGIFAAHQGIVVATDLGLLTQTEGQSDWNRITWQDFGLETIDRIRQIDADTYFVSVADGGEIQEFWMLDLKSKTKKPFAVPSPAYFLGNIRKTSRGDYIVAIKFDVYRTDGVTYTKIFSQDELYSLPKVSGTFLNVFRLQLDPTDRVWFDTGYGVVRIDLY